MWITVWQFPQTVQLKAAGRAWAWHLVLQASNVGLATWPKIQISYALGKRRYFGAHDFKPENPTVSADSSCPLVSAAEAKHGDEF